MSNYRIYFYIEKRKVSGKLRRQDAPVIMRFSYDKKRLVLSTGLNGNLDQWSAKDQRFKNSAANATEKNSKLKGLRDKIESVFLKAETIGVPITNDYLKNEMRGTSQGTFIDLYDEFVRSESSTQGLADATLILFDAMRRHLLKLNAVGVPLNFHEISHAWYLKIWNYSLEKGHTNSTAMQYLAKLNWFFNWCRTAKGMDIPQVNFKPKDPAATIKKPENLVYLRADEFLHFLTFKQPSDDYEVAKDVFLFLCTTGLRISDLKRLRKHHITDDEIHITTQKTNDSITIPLNEFSRSIIEKYENHYLLTDGEVLPYIPLLRLNNTIREAAKQAGLKRMVTKISTKSGRVIRKDLPLHELISSHAGRRTFVSLSIALNINSNILMTFTGHTKPDTLKHYIGIGKKVQRQAMDNFSGERIMKIV